MSTVPVGLQLNSLKISWKAEGREEDKQQDELYTWSTLTAATPA
jgi:hypothetical protein